MMEVLKILNDQLSKDVNYSFMFYDKEKVIYPYWISEIFENVPIHEGEPYQTTVLLTGTTRQSYSKLLDDKETIIKLLDNRCFKNGKTSIRCFYDSSMFIPTDESNLKRIQMTFQINEWKGE